MLFGSADDVHCIGLFASLCSLYRRFFNPGQEKNRCFYRARPQGLRTSIFILISVSIRLLQKQGASRINSQGVYL